MFVISKSQIAILFTFSCRKMLQSHSLHRCPLGGMQITGKSYPKDPRRDCKAAISSVS